MNYKKFINALEKLKETAAAKNKSKDFEKGFQCAIAVIEIIAIKNQNEEEYGELWKNLE